MRSVAYELVVEQGADNKFGFKHNIPELLGSEAMVHFKKKLDQPPVLELTTANEKIVITDTEIRLLISREDSMFLELGNEYDLIVELPSGFTKILRGRVKLIKGVTV